MRTFKQELKVFCEVCLIGASAYLHYNYGELADTGFDATQIPLNLSLMEHAVDLNKEQMAEIWELIQGTPEQVLNPGLWPK